MILQISSGQGPAECELAVCKLYEALQKEYPDIREINVHNSRFSNCYTSVMLESTEDLSDLEGTVQWICQSPYRPGHKRKNWLSCSKTNSLNSAGCRSTQPGRSTTVSSEEIR